MASKEKFCLRWNDFEKNISGAFQEIRNDKDFFDVTVACEEGQVSAHKVILSACSPFFKAVLRRNPHQHPLLYFKGIRHSEMAAVMDFMYQGEVSVAQEDLNTFLSVAEELKIKGLTQNESDNKQSGHTSSSSRRDLDKKSNHESHNNQASYAQYKKYQESHEEPEADIQEIVPVKTEAPGPGEVAMFEEEQEYGGAEYEYEEAGADTSLMLADNASRGQCKLIMTRVMKACLIGYDRRVCLCLRICIIKAS